MSRNAPKHLKQKPGKQRPVRKAEHRISFKRVLAFLGYSLLLTIILAPLIVFKGPFQSLKEFAVGTIFTSRHPQLVEAFLSDDEIQNIINSNNDQGVGTGVEVSTSNVTTESDAGITIEDIQGKNFKGKVMILCHS